MKKSGTISNFQLTPRLRSDRFGFEFNGYIDIASSGTYTFYTTSDDGSLLYIDGAKIVDNNGIHDKQERSGSKYLSKGKHAIRVAYFEKSGGQVLEVRYAGPGISKRLIPDSKLFRSSNAREENNTKSISGEEVISTINESTKEEILIYPNPVQGQLNISVSGINNEQMVLKLYGNEGLTIYENTILLEGGAKNLQLDMSEYATKSGIYYVVLEGSEGSRTVKKIIKQ